VYSNGIAKCRRKTLAKRAQNFHHVDYRQAWEKPWESGGVLRWCLWTRGDGRVEPVLQLGPLGCVVGLCVVMAGSNMDRLDTAFCIHSIWHRHLAHTQERTTWKNGIPLTILTLTSARQLGAMELRPRVAFRTCRTPLSPLVASAGCFVACRRSCPPMQT
jgi:hypothetical protein